MNLKYKQSSPVNLCNKFLVDYLAKMRKACQRRGNDKKSFVYLHAIASIKKYPLPIICEKQLKLLQGIGDVLSEDLLRVVKMHYAHFLRKHEQQQQDNQENQPNNDELQSKSQPCKEAIQNSQSQWSCRSAVGKEYKPRPKTQAYFILQILKKHSQQPCEKQFIRGILKSEYKQNVSSTALGLVFANLEKSHFIGVSGQNLQFAYLREKGEKFLEKIQEKMKTEKSKHKVKDLVMSFRGQCKNSTQIQEYQQEKQSKSKILSVQELDKNELTLLIDNRQIKNKEDQSYFSQKLSQNFNINCCTVNLPIGDFLWTYQGNVINYIVQRKKADDLASSIRDGRYKQQKLRLKNCQVDNIFYVYEGHLSARCSNQQRQVDSSLLGTRIRDGFKVVKVGDIAETVRFISYLHCEILQRILKDKQVKTFGKINEFVRVNAKNKQMTVGKLFGLGLKSLPGIGKNTVSELLKHFSCFTQLRNELGKLETKGDRVEFLRQLFRGSGIRNKLPNLLVEFLFSNDYKCYEI